MNITRIGIDLGKSWFQVGAMDRHDRVVLERKLSRRRLERFLGELAPCTVAMEACGGAHHGARRAQSHGHRARLGQRSTGGRTTLLGISKRRDRYLRELLVHGARAALRTAAKRDDAQARRAQEVARRRGTNVATVALVNKMLRTAWAMSSNGTVCNGHEAAPAR